MHHITAAKLVGQDACQALPTCGGGWSLQWSHGRGIALRITGVPFFPSHSSFSVGKTHRFLWVLDNAIKQPPSHHHFYRIHLPFPNSWLIVPTCWPSRGPTVVAKWQYIAGTKSHWDSATLRCLEDASTPQHVAHVILTSQKPSVKPPEKHRKTVFTASRFPKLRGLASGSFELNAHAALLRALRSNFRSGKNACCWLFLMSWHQ
jgi:hypothetical protein